VQVVERVLLDCARQGSERVVPIAEHGAEGLAPAAVPSDRGAPDELLELDVGDRLGRLGAEVEGQGHLEGGRGRSAGHIRSWPSHRDASTAGGPGSSRPRPSAMISGKLWNAAAHPARRHAPAMFIVHPGSLLTTVPAPLARIATTLSRTIAPEISGYLT